jgi:uncharacterized delta-60 repeat protein
VGDLSAAVIVADVIAAVVLGVLVDWFRKASFQKSYESYSTLEARMQQEPFLRQVHLLSLVSIRLGLSLVIGILAILLMADLVSDASHPFAQTGFPRPGDLDATFGTGGIVITPIGTGRDLASGVAVQPDGKIVVAGPADSGGDLDFAVIRYTISGTLDTTFGAGGVVTTPIGSGWNEATDVAIQADGKIVAAGFADDGNSVDFAIARYVVSGMLDATFGSTGVVTTPIGSGSAFANSIAIQSDGKILMAGHADNGSDWDFTVVRYTISGTLDTAFGNTGVVTTPVGFSEDFADGLAIQPDGKIVVVGGSAHNDSDFDFAVVRYTAAGTLDNTFGSSGIVTTPIGPGRDIARAVAVQADGRIVVAGHADNGSDNDFALVRYGAFGALDSTFGAGGVTTTPVGSYFDSAYGVAIQPDGKIVATGSTWYGSDRDFALVRYAASGVLDSTFGNGGVVTTPIGRSFDGALDVAIQPDGKIVAAGSASNGSDADFAVVRYHAGCFVYLPLVLRN